MTASLAYLVGVSLIAWATIQLRHRASYNCPACASKRADGHSRDCPWSTRP